MIQPTDASRFVAYFGVPMHEGRPVQPDPGAPCRWCCHWSLPLAVPHRKVGDVIVPLAYVEWLIWHWHVLHHQGGVPVS